MESKLEHILINSYKSDLIRYIQSHPEDFEEVIELALSNRQPYSWRATWILWSCMEKNDKRILKYINQIIDSIPKSPDNQIRELLIILQRMDIDDAYEGKLFDYCIDLWEKIDKQPSLRYNAFKLMIQIIKKHPDLYSEIIWLTESRYLDTFSDNVRKSISITIERIRKINKNTAANKR
jgi:hypothetical protein